VCPCRSDGAGKYDIRFFLTIDTGSADDTGNAWQQVEYEHSIDNATDYECSKDRFHAVTYS